MNIYLGNYKPDIFCEAYELEKEDFKQYLISNNIKYCENADGYKENEYHCFDIPRIMICGSKETAIKLTNYLQTKETITSGKYGALQIAWI